MAPHSSTLAWEIPWMEEPGGLQSMRSLRVGHDWATSLSLFTFMHWRRKWQPIPVFLPGESQGQGSLVSCCYGVAQSRTQLKQLGGSSIYDVNLLLHSLLIAFPSLFQHVDDFFLLIPKGSSYGLNVLSQNAYVVALILTMMEFGSGSFGAWVWMRSCGWSPREDMGAFIRG